MPDTPKTTAQLQTVFAEGQSKGITASDLRDTVVSVLNKSDTGSQSIASALVVGSTCSAALFSGSGASLTNLPAGNLTGTIPDARFPATLPTSSGANLTNLNASNVSSGTVADARLSNNIPKKDTANTFTANQTVTGTLAATALTGAGSGITGLNGSNIASGTVADARLSTNVAKKDVDNNFSASQTIDGVLIGDETVTCTQLTAQQAYVGGSFNVNNTGTVTAANYFGDGANLTNLNYNAISNPPAMPEIPTTVSSFTNDAGYLTSAYGGVPSNMSGVVYGNGYSLASDVNVTFSSGSIIAYGINCAYATSSFDGGTITTNGSGNLSVNGTINSGVFGTAGVITVDDGTGVAGTTINGGSITTNGTLSTGSADIYTNYVYGAGASFASSQINLNSDGSVGISGEVVLAANVLMTGLPTSDPMNPGQLWNDSGTLKVS